jgi:hypothetical protein
VKRSIEKKTDRGTTLKRNAAQVIVASRQALQKTPERRNVIQKTLYATDRVSINP